MQFLLERDATLLFIIFSTLPSSLRLLMLRITIWRLTCCNYGPVQGDMLHVEEPSLVFVHPKSGERERTETHPNKQIENACLKFSSIGHLHTHAHYHKVNHDEIRDKEVTCCSYVPDEVLCCDEVEISSHEGYNSCRKMQV